MPTQQENQQRFEALLAAGESSGRAVRRVLLGVVIAILILMILTSRVLTNGVGGDVMGVDLFGFLRIVFYNGLSISIVSDNDDAPIALMPRGLPDGARAALDEYIQEHTEAYRDYEIRAEGRTNIWGDPWLPEDEKLTVPESYEITSAREASNPDYYLLLRLDELWCVVVEPSVVIEARYSRIGYGMANQFELRRTALLWQVSPGGDQDTWRALGCENWNEAGS